MRIINFTQRNTLVMLRLSIEMDGLITSNYMATIIFYFEGNDLKILRALYTVSLASLTSILSRV